LKPSKNFNFFSEKSLELFHHRILKINQEMQEKYELLIQKLNSMELENKNLKESTSQVFEQNKLFQSFVEHSQLEKEELLSNVNNLQSTIESLQNINHQNHQLLQNNQVILEDAVNQLSKKESKILEMENTMKLLKSQKEEISKDSNEQRIKLEKEILSLKNEINLLKVIPQVTIPSSVKEEIIQNYELNEKRSKDERLKLLERFEKFKTSTLSVSSTRKN
jgi:hypothetical protein